MLEFPECIIFANEMKQQLCGKRILEVKVNQSPHKFAFFSRDTKEYKEILESLQVDDCNAYGGLIEVKIGEYRLVFSDGAYPRYTKPMDKQPDKHQLWMEFEDHSILTVRIQMYGCIFLYHESEEKNSYYELAMTKPSPLSKEFSYEYFNDLCNSCSKKISVKALLATNQRIPGLGNGVLQDILYQAKIHPKRSVDSLSGEDKIALYESIQSVLEEMTEQGGRDTEKDFFGQEGKYITYLSKKTYLTPCPRCGYEIRKAAYMGGTVYFCERCQPV